MAAEDGMAPILDEETLDAAQVDSAGVLLRRDLDLEGLCLLKVRIPTTAAVRGKTRDELMITLLGCR